MRKQILAAGICLCLALAPAVSTASPNAGEPLAEEAAPASEMTVEEAAPANEPVTAQADPQSLDEEAPGEAVVPATSDELDGKDVVEADSAKTSETGERLLANPDGVLSAQFSNAVYSLSDGVFTTRHTIANYATNGDSAVVYYTFTLPHRSRIDIVLETLPSRTSGYIETQLFETRRNVSWSMSSHLVNHTNRMFEYTAHYTDLDNPPKSVAPGEYVLAVRYRNPSYSTSSCFCWNEVKLDIKPLYSDLPKDHWAANVVADAVDRGFMSGFDDTAFGTNYNISRAQVASVLWNLQGQPWPGSTYSFRDVPTDKYYSTAVAWARSAGVVSGYPDGSFRPGQNVAREELAVMLHNYAVRFRGASNSGAGSASYSGMGDKYSVSWYASDAVGWCFSRGIMSGSNWYIRPSAPASRAEAAKMFLLTGNLLGI